MLNGRTIEEVAGVPEGITFTDGGYPIDNHGKGKYGKYTVYVATYGSVYHSYTGCSSAVTEMNYMYVKDHYKYKYYRWCMKCRSNIEIPEWYTKYRELRDLKKKFEL